MAVDGFAAPSRRKSVSGASTKSLNRIAALLKEEAKPFDKEIAHEKAVNQSLPHLSGSLSLGSFDSMLNDDEMEELDEIVGEDTEYDRLQGMSPSRRASISARQQVGNRGMPSGSSRPSTAPSSLPNVPTTPRTDRSMVLPMPDTDRLQSRESTPETFAAAGQPVTPGGSGAAVVPVAVRAVAIPNSALKDPATYVSHSSRLNPENSFLSKQYEMMLSSPSLSPVHTIHGSASPSGSERKGKRKLSVSGDTDRFEPYMKKVHRMPSSPTIHSPTFNMSHNFPMSLGSSGSNSSSHQPYRMATPPPPISLPYPLVFQRQRSPSVSSQSSGTGSMWGVERTTAAAGSLPAVMSHNRSSTPSFNSNQNTTSASASAMMVSNTPPPSSSLGTPPTQSHHLSHLAAVQGLAVPPPSPRSLGQMLNLTGTQEGFTKMSITE
ncbi:hypothetical protein DFS34DRAFT_447689 [Phlyctochytrium arcticum]|nr:hypothetical protein DFS34DRAFT_447689 [Phlyctochytrium arcticum]